MPIATRDSHTKPPPPCFKKIGKWFFDLGGKCLFNWGAFDIMDCKNGNFLNFYMQEKIA